MPQLWLTYQEMAQEFGGSAEGARAFAVSRSLTRKHSRDGHTRVLMPSDLMTAYCVRVASDPAVLDKQADFMVKQLRGILDAASLSKTFDDRVSIG